jgi:RNA polymerase sigma-70 factor (ECF subfamily)
VALNLCYDRLRRRREIPTETPPDRPDEGPAPDRGLLAAETGMRVDAALKRLPERQREAVVLCHYQELSNIEAAALMEISVEALESLLSRGRRALRLALADMAPGASEGDGR